MDALALLCNLHADGPATLQRLRRIGCESIDGVAGLGEGELGKQLRQDEAGARRFKREAHNLQVRLVGGTPMPEPEEVEPELEVVPEPKLPGMSHVLEAWRLMDEQSPPPEPSVMGGSQAMDEPEVTSPEVDNLNSAVMDGLTPEVLKRLKDLGIDTVDGLVEASSLELSQDLPMPLTRVKRLQLLARRVRTHQAMREEGASEPDLLPLPTQVLRPLARVLDAVATEQKAEPTPEPDLLPELPMDVIFEQRVAPQPELSEAQTATLEQAQELQQDEGFQPPISEEHPSLGRFHGEDPELDRLDSGGPFA